MDSESLYVRARVAGQAAAPRLRVHKTADMVAFYCWAASQPEFAGLEAAWRQFMMGVDPQNAEWAEWDE